MGWTSLFVGVLIPSVASVEAMRLFWTGRCAGTIRWTAVPLLIGCEPLSPARLTLGWIATIVYVTALVVAAVVAVCAAVMFSCARDKRRTVPCLIFSAATATVATAIALVLLSNPDRQGNATGAWIVHASFVGLAAYVGAGLLSLAVHFAGTRTRPPWIKSRSSQ